MRLCAPVYNYRSADEWVERHTKAGYGAALWPLGRDAADAEIDAYAKAAEPKELFVVPGATHVDVYDQPEYLKITLPKLDSFFKQHLK